MFTDRNFATGLLFMAVTGVLLLAGLALLPPLLQRLYGYSVLPVGHADHAARDRDVDLDADRRAACRNMSTRAGWSRWAWR